MWRPGFPEQIKGFDAYSQLYADSKKWLNEGWLDYFTPQLYWPIARPETSYPVLLRWWISENTRKRNIWPGNFTSRVGGTGDTAWPVQEILDQISTTRLTEGAGGNVHFSMKVFMQNRDSLDGRLLAGPYAAPALVPSSPWLDSIPPRAPLARLERDSATRAIKVVFSPRGTDKVWLWVLRYRYGPDWSTMILPADGAHVRWGYRFVSPGSGRRVGRGQNRKRKRVHDSHVHSTAGQAEACSAEALGGLVGFLE
jgi:hypothetical protein